MMNFDSLLNVEFQWPWILLAIPLFACIFVIPVIKRQHPAIYFPYLDKIIDTNKRLNTSIFWWRIGQLLLWTLLCFALARPQMVGEPWSNTQFARNLVLALDISESMATQDMVVSNVRVNRLDVAKNVLKSFIRRRSGDQIGLVLFGSNAYIQAPLTFDTNTVQALLDETEIGIAGQKTAIGDALLLSVKLIENTDNANSENSSIILLSDGSNTSGKVAPLVARDLAKENNIRIYTIGLGSNRFQQDVDERTLIQIAKSTGGIYFRAQNTNQLVTVYNQLDKLNQVETRQQNYRPRHEIYYMPLSAALLWALALLAFRMGMPTKLAFIRRHGVNIFNKRRKL